MGCGRPGPVFGPAVQYFLACGGLSDTPACCCGCVDILSCLLYGWQLQVYCSGDNGHHDLLSSTVTVLSVPINDEHRGSTVCVQARGNSA